MSWLLSSESIQWSNQRRLHLDDLKLLYQGGTLELTKDETPDNVEINTIKIGHHKGRSKDKTKREKGKDFDTIGYKKKEILFLLHTLTGIMTDGSSTIFTQRKRFVGSCRRF